MTKWLLKGVGYMGIHCKIHPSLLFENLQYKNRGEPCLMKDIFTCATLSLTHVHIHKCLHHIHLYYFGKSAPS